MPLAALALKRATPARRPPYHPDALGVFGTKATGPISRTACSVNVVVRPVELELAPQPFVKRGLALKRTCDEYSPRSLHARRRRAYMTQRSGDGAFDDKRTCDEYSPRSLHARRRRAYMTQRSGDGAFDDNVHTFDGSKLYGRMKKHAKALVEGVSSDSFRVTHRQFTAVCFLRICLS